MPLSPLNSSDIYDYSLPLSQYDDLIVSEAIALILKNDELRESLRINSIYLNDLQVLRMPSTRVTDSVLLLGNYNQHNKLIGIIHLSQKYDPLQVFNSCNNAYSINSKISSVAESHILLPIHMGFIEGRSFSYTECMHPLSEGFYWKIQKRLIQKSVLSWLVEVAASFSDADKEKTYQNICFFEGRNGLSNEFVSEASSALHSLEAGYWKPVNVPDHNDLWRGNILISGNRYGFRNFKVIDWGASNVYGYGVHDLLTFSLSFGVSAKKLASYIARYSDVLAIDKNNISFQYIAGIGRLGVNLNNFPYVRFCEKVNREFSLLKQALSILK